MKRRDATSSIRLQVMWTRLIALVEEQAQTLLRTAFSPIVRESGDLSAGIFDLQGRMLAQAVTGTPGHINTMARSVGYFLDVFPISAMAAGDVFVTNDPWHGTGHLNDYVVLSPAFHNGRIVALFACTGHMTDVGGIGLSPDGTDLFMEGVAIPIMKLVDDRRINETLMAIAKANSRTPFELEGDIYSLMASNETAKRRLSDVLDEVGQEDIAELADYVIDSSRQAISDRIAGLPGGEANYAMVVDGFEAPVTLQAKLTIVGSRITVDWSGTTAASRFGINVPLNYAAAYTSYALACAIAGDIPNNHGTLSGFEIRAPEGSILNAVRPMPVACRHIIGGLLPDVIFGCLDQLLPGRVPAESASALWTLTLRGDGAEAFVISIVTNGGTGARPGLDGLSATSFPSAVRGTPVEIVEAKTPLIFWRRELRSGSGGDGQWRGGLGQDMEIGILGADPFRLFAAFDRISQPARGRSGGTSGGCGELFIKGGPALAGKGTHLINAGDRLVVRTPGGGGFGPPNQRSHETRAEDLAAGYAGEYRSDDHQGREKGVNK